VKKWPAKFERVVTSCRDFLDEKGLGTANSAPLSRVQRFLHFWLMVAKSFARNRCPVHATALAYTTLLALIPMLFVVISISTAFLKQPVEQARLNHFIDRIVEGLTPPSAPATKTGKRKE